jgi:hypothetical protein
MPNLYLNSKYPKSLGALYEPGPGLLFLTSVVLKDVPKRLVFTVWKFEIS